MKKILLGLFILCSLPSLAYIHIDEAVSIIREKLGPKTMISHISAKQLGVDGYLTENTIVNIRYVPYEDRSSFVSLSMSDVINEQLTRKNAEAKKLIVRSSGQIGNAAAIFFEYI